MRIAEAAIAAFQEHMALAGANEVEQHRLVILVHDLRADRNAQHDILAGGAAAIRAHAVMPGLRTEMLLIAIIDERVEIGDRLDHDIAAAPAIAAIGSTELDKFLAPERDDAGAAVTALQIDLRLIEEFHGLSPEGAKQKGGMWPFPLISSMRARN